MTDSASGEPDSITRGETDTVAGGVPDTASGGVPDSATGGLYNSVAGCVLDTAARVVPDTVAGGLYDSVSGGVLGTVSGGVPGTVLRGLYDSGVKKRTYETLLRLREVGRREVLQSSHPPENRVVHRPACHVSVAEVACGLLRLVMKLTLLEKVPLQESMLPSEAQSPETVGRDHRQITVAVGPRGSLLLS